jgi:hypothetical protein
MQKNIIKKNYRQVSKKQKGTIIKGLVRSVDPSETTCSIPSSISTIIYDRD